jgi:putative lipoic acid-binding regulatory protein
MASQTPPCKPSSSDEKKGGLTFPCEFVIKVFGLASDEFKNNIPTVIRKYQPNLSKDSIQSRPSKDGKYLALSITVYVESQEQLDTIYRELSTNPAVLMAL